MEIAFTHKSIQSDIKVFILADVSGIQVTIFELQAASKSTVAKVNKVEKLNADNYEIWSMKMQYVLEEQEVLRI